MNSFPCPVIGCPHYPRGNGPKLHSLTTLIRHLKGKDHKKSRHLLDHNICNEIKLFRCTHSDCSDNTDIFFHSQTCLDEHNKTRHPNLRPTSNGMTSFEDYTNIIFLQPGSNTLTNNWNSGTEFILHNYDSPRPHFRSTWRRYLSGNNRTKFYKIMSNIIKAIIKSNETNDSAVFWWLLLHYEMLILAPTQNDADDDNINQKSIIRQRLIDFQSGNIERLLNNSSFNTNWNQSSPRPPHRKGNSAAQLAADGDNYRTAITRACTFNKIATITDENQPTVQNLYPHHREALQTTIPPTNTNQLHLPGNICDTIRHANRNKGTGVFSDSIDAFIHLVKQNIPSTNADIQQLFNLVYQGHIPQQARHFFTDTYLFCLHKDISDNKKLRPIGIPTAIRRIMASHIAHHWKDKFALHLLPYNFAVGVPNGMDFIIKTMQLSIERFIKQPQQHNKAPTRAAVFVDLTNMFNSVSRCELFDVIATDFPELYNLTSLLYGSDGTVHYKWNQTEWKHLFMEDGVNQGCPLSPIFATLVLHRVLQPIAKALYQRASERLKHGHTGDDGFGSIAHLFAYMDDISSMLAHEDVEFFCTEIERLGLPRGCIINPQKTRILTSCSGFSILPDIDPPLADILRRTIERYSVETNADNTTTPIELTSGFRVLGTPVGSKEFAREFYIDQLTNVRAGISSMTDVILDTQTKLKLFSNCIIQKLPHLLDSEIMHFYPTDDDANFQQWYNWAGELTNEMDLITTSFFKHLLSIPASEPLPEISKLIYHLNINRGGLGIVNPSFRAAPDFVLNMMMCKRRSRRGFHINNDIKPVYLHQSITDLYDIDHNNTSTCLQIYQGLLPHIGTLCCSPKMSDDEKLPMFESNISLKSARDRLKKAIGSISLSQIYMDTFNTNKELLLLLPSMLSPQTSYPLIGMCRSKIQHRLPNWITELALKRKLRVPIFPAQPPICKCGIQHDKYGDHSFKCNRISKKQGHNIIRDCWAEALQPALATAGYIRHTTKLDIERRHINTRDISAQPFDICFDPDPPTSSSNHIHCPYTTIGADITIGNCRSKFPSRFNRSADVITSISALADKHLQTFERKKFKRADKVNTHTAESIRGDEVMEDLVNNNMILLPLALDSFGRWGLTMQNFLFHTATTPCYKFKNNAPNAAIMAFKATTPPCPLGILQSADVIWKKTQNRPFYGHSYTAPTPSLHTIQQLGLGITKGLMTTLRHAINISTPRHATEETSGSNSHRRSYVDSTS